MEKHRLARLIALLMAFALVAAACGGGSEAGSDGNEPVEEDTPSTTVGGADSEVTTTAIPDVDKFGGELVMGLEAEATGLRPWEDPCSAPCYNMGIAMFDKLMEQDIDGNVQPYLAESVSSNEDFTVWTMNLRAGVTFHNGVELTAQSIADMFPIQQAGANSAGTVNSAGMETVEATGDLEVTYTLNKPNSAFPAFLTRNQVGFVFEAGAATADPDGLPVGTGPFVIETRDLNNETVMVRNDSYWQSDAAGDQLPYLDSITFRPTPDEGTRLAALVSGTVNAMHTLRQSTIRDAREEDGITLLEFQGNNVGGGMYNTAVAPYDDVRVRRGLTMMNSQEKVIEALGGAGISDPATQWFSPDSPWYSEKAAAAYASFDFPAGQALVQQYVDDPERSDGKAVGEKIEVELSCPPDPTLIAGMQVIEQAWTASELVEVNLTNFDQQTHIGNALGAPPDFVGVHGAHCWRFSSEQDPSFDINNAVAPPSPAVAEAAGIPGVVSPLNFSNYFDGEVFGAAVAAVQTDDFDERYALYESIMIKFAEDAPGWYSGHTATMIATADNVNGFNGWLLPSGDIGIGFPAAEGRYHEVWISE